MTTRSNAHLAAAFYGSSSRAAAPVNPTWLDRIVETLGEHSLSPILFTASGGGFELDDCHLFGQTSERLALWGEEINSHRDALIASLKRGEVVDLTLDVPCATAMDRSEWRALASASSTTQELVLGFEENLVSGPSAVLRQLLEVAHDLVDVHYGFAYSMPLADNPECYASGIGRATTLADFRTWLRQRSEGTLPPKSDDELWHDELNEDRRHLTGLFRGAYPANLLSEAHLKSADLRRAGLGKLSAVGGSLWLWELIPAEIPQAESWLEDKEALVRQHRPR